MNKAILIEIVPYNPDWPVEFRRVAAPLRAALGDLALRIDHIGSRGDYLSGLCPQPLRLPCDIAGLA